MTLELRWVLAPLFVRARGTFYLPVVGAGALVCLLEGTELGSPASEMYATGVP